VASARGHTAAGQVFEQRLGHLGVLGRAFAKAEHVFMAFVVNPRRADHVVRAELDPIDPDGQEVEPGEIAPGQVVQEALTGLDRRARDLAPGGAHRPGHLGEDWLVAPGRGAGDEDLEHPLGEAAVAAHRLIGGDLDLGRLALPRIAAAQAGFVDDDLAFLECDTSLLAAVVDDVAVGLLALLPGARDGLGAHPEHRLDGGGP
jgi:hypothetical protein